MQDINSPFDQFHHTRVRIMLTLNGDKVLFRGAPAMPAAWYIQDITITQGNQSAAYPFAVYATALTHNSAFRPISPEEVKTGEVNCNFIQN